MGIVRAFRVSETEIQSISHDSRVTDGVAYEKLAHPCRYRPSFLRHYSPFQILQANELEGGIVPGFQATSVMCQCAPKLVGR